MPLSDRFRDLDQLIADAMDGALEDASRSLAAEVRRRTSSLAHDARRRTLEDLQAAFRRLDSAAGQSELLTALLEETGRFASRTALLITHEDRARGWGAFGFPAGGEGMARIEIPYDGPWRDLARGTGCVALDSEACAVLSAPLAADAPVEGVLVPLVLRDRVAAALYADRLDDEAPFEATAIRLLVLTAAQGLELQALRRRTSTPTLAEAREGQEGLPLWPAEGAVPTAEPPEEPAPSEQVAQGATSETVPPEERVEGATPKLEAASAWGTVETAEPAGEGPTEEVSLLPAAEEASGPWEGPEETWPGMEAEESEGPEAAGSESGQEAGEDELALAEPELMESEEAFAEAPELEAEEETPTPELEATEAPSAEQDEDLGLEPTTPLPRADDAVPEATVRLSRDALRQAGGLPAAGQGDASEGGRSVMVGSPEVEAEPPPPSSPQPPPPRHPEPATPPPAGGGSSSTEVTAPPDLEGPGWAFRDQESATPPGPARDPEQAALHEEARRLARLLVSEIKLYNEEQVEEGRRNRDLYSRLQEDIDRSRQMYEERVDPGVRQEADYFQQEMVSILAGGDSGALGM